MLTDRNSNLQLLFFFPSLFLAAMFGVRVNETTGTPTECIKGKCEERTNYQCLVVCKTNNPRYELRITDSMK